MKKLYDIAAKAGTYQKDGATKNRYVNIGAMMEGDNGPFLFLKAHVNLAAFTRKEGSEDVLCSLFQPKDAPAGDGYDWKAAEDRQRAATNGAKPAATPWKDDEPSDIPY